MSDENNPPKNSSGRDAPGEHQFIDPVTGKPAHQPPPPKSQSAPPPDDAVNAEPQGWLPPAPNPGAASGPQAQYGGWLPPAPGPPPGTAITPSQPRAAAMARDYAGWWSRVGANIVDSLIVSIPVIALGLIVYFVFIGDAITFNDELEPTGESLDAGQIIVMIFATLVALIYAFGYAPFWMARTNGQTIGKQVAGIRVIRVDGQPIGFWFAAAREVGLKGLGVGAAGQLTFGIASLLNYLWPLWDAENRAVHDLIIKTRVVKARPPAASEAAAA